MTPKVDLEYAIQFLGTLYGSVTAIHEARNLVAEQHSVATKIAAENESKQKDITALDATRRDLEGKVAQARADLAEYTRKAEEARATAASEESRLKVIRQQLAEVRAQFLK